MAEADESTEQCATCRKHVHTQCMKEWIKQKKDRGDELLCVLCRSAWKDEEGRPRSAFLCVTQCLAREVTLCLACRILCCNDFPQPFTALLCSPARRIAGCCWHSVAGMVAAHASVHKVRACAGAQMTAGGYLNLAGQHGHAPNLGELYGETAQWLSCEFAGLSGRGRRGGRYGGGGGGRRRGRGRY